MKRAYVQPLAKKIAFDYEETVVASPAYGDLPIEWVSPEELKDLKSCDAVLYLQNEIPSTRSIIGYEDCV